MVFLVFFLRHGSQVRWVYARRIVAHVVDLHTLRDATDHHFVGNPVSIEFLLADTESTVSVDALAAGPFPAIAGFVYVRPEPLAWGSTPLGERGVSMPTPALIVQAAHPALVRFPLTILNGANLGYHYRALPRVMGCSARPEKLSAASLFYSFVLVPAYIRSLQIASTLCKMVP